MGAVASLRRNIGWRIDYIPASLGLGARATHAVSRAEFGERSRSGCGGIFTSLRTRLILAFFTLSVVPLGAVTFYAYTANVNALRDAAERAADLLAGELGQRMQLVTAQLSERVQHLMDIAELQSAAEPASVNGRVKAEPRRRRPPSSAWWMIAKVLVGPVVVTQTALTDSIAKSLGEAAMLLNNVELPEHAGLRAGCGWRTRRAEDAEDRRNGAPPRSEVAAPIAPRRRAHRHRRHPLVRQQQSRQRRPFQLQRLRLRPLTRSGRGASATDDRIRVDGKVRRQMRRGNRRTRKVRNRARVQDQVHNQARRR